MTSLRVGDVRSVGRAIRGPVLIVAAVALGLLFPAPDALAVATTPLVAFLVFGAVHGRNFASFRADGRPQFTAGALGVVFLLPVAFAPVAAAFLDGHALVGVLVAIAAPPTAGSAIVWTRRGNGDTVTTVLLAVTAIALAPLVTPAVLAAVLDFGVVIDPLSVARELLAIVVVGVALAWIIPEEAVDETTLDHLSLVVVGALIYVGTATTAIGDLATPTLVTVGLLAVGFLALAAGVAVGFVPFVGRERGVSLFFTAGLRNLGIAVAVAATLPVEGVVVAVVVFYVTQQLVAALAAETVLARPFGRVDSLRTLDG